jgi:hypothetical protein
LGVAIAPGFRFVHSNMNLISASTWAEIRTAYASGIVMRKMLRCSLFRFRATKN